MGRKKLKMELILNKKSRDLCFKKRKDNVIKKTQELTTLCDVEACVIIYGPNDDEGAIVWPPDADRVIGLYHSHIKAGKSCKRVGVSDFLNDKIKKAEEDAMKLRKAKYPCWNADLESVRDPVVLRRFADGLKDKIEVANARIDFLKKQEFIRNHNQENAPPQQFYAGGSMFYSDQPTPSHDQASISGDDTMFGQYTLPCMDSGDYLINHECLDFLPAPQPYMAFPVDDDISELLASLNDGEAFPTPEPFPMMDMDDDEMSELLASLNDGETFPTPEPFSVDDDISGLLASLNDPVDDDISGLLASLNDGETFPAPEPFPMMDMDDDEMSELLASLW